jgi:hypothetical protein
MQYLFFQAVQNPRPFNQPSAATYLFQGDALRWLRTYQNLRFAYGATLDRSFRWNKSGSEAVTPSGGFSVGPKVQLVLAPPHYSFSQSSFEIGSSLAFPLTGLLTDTHSAINGNIWFERRWTKLFRDATVGLKLEVDMSFVRWKSPTDTSVLNWVGWLGFVLYNGF